MMLTTLLLVMGLVSGLVAQQRNQQQDQSTMQQQDRVTMQGRTAATGQLELKKANDIVGARVQNQRGENLGRVDDIVLDSQHSKVEYLAISHGGFLGIGDKLIAVPFEAFQTRTDNGDLILILNVDRQQFEQAQGFDSNRWPERGDQRWLTGAAADGRGAYGYQEGTPSDEGSRRREDGMQRRDEGWQRRDEQHKRRDERLEDRRRNGQDENGTFGYQNDRSNDSFQRDLYYYDDKSDDRQMQQRKDTQRSNGVYGSDQRSTTSTRETARLRTDRESTDVYGFEPRYQRDPQRNGREIYGQRPEHQRWPGALADRWEDRDVYGYRQERQPSRDIYGYEGDRFQQIERDEQRRWNDRDIYGYDQRYDRRDTMTQRDRFDDRDRYGSDQRFQQQQDWQRQQRQQQQYGYDPRMQQQQDWQRQQQQDQRFQRDRFGQQDWQRQQEMQRQQQYGYDPRMQQQQDWQRQQQQDQRFQQDRFGQQQDWQRQQDMQQQRPQQQDWQRQQQQDQRFQQDRFGQQQDWQRQQDMQRQQRQQQDWQRQQDMQRQQRQQQDWQRQQQQDQRFQQDRFGQQDQQRQQGFQQDRFGQQDQQRQQQYGYDPRLDQQQQQRSQQQQRFDTRDPYGYDHRYEQRDSRDIYGYGGVEGSGSRMSPQEFDQRWDSQRDAGQVETRSTQRNGTFGYQNDTGRESRVGTTTTAEVRERRATRLTGRGVRNRQDANLGDIEDLVIDMNSGRVIYGLISYGGFLGIGKDMAVVPWEAIDIRAAQDNALLETTRERMAQFEYDSDSFQQLSDRQYAERLFAHYGTQPSQVFGFEPDQQPMSPQQQQMQRQQDMQRQQQPHQQDAQRQQMRGAWAPDSQFNRHFKAEEIQTIEGEVQTIGSFRPDRQSADGLRLRVRTEDDRTLVVYTGPHSFMLRQGLRLRTGDDVTIRGSRATIEGREVLLASSIEVDDRTVQIRDQQGRPMWTAQDLQTSGQQGTQRQDQQTRQQGMQGQDQQTRQQGTQGQDQQRQQQQQQQYR